MTSDNDKPSKVKKTKTGKVGGDAQKRKGGKNGAVTVPGGGLISENGEEFWEVSGLGMSGSYDDRIMADVYSFGRVR